MTNFKEMKGLVSGRPDFVKKWHEQMDKAEVTQTEWISKLRAQGFKAAHPNDGWVDRDNMVLIFVYPHFNYGATAGDLVVLGWPSDKPEELKIIRLLERVESWCDFLEKKEDDRGGKWTFEYCHSTTNYENYVEGRMEGLDGIRVENYTVGL